MRPRKPVTRCSDTQPSDMDREANPYTLEPDPPEI